MPGSHLVDLETRIGLIVSPEPYLTIRSVCSEGCESAFFECIAGNEPSGWDRLCWGVL